MAGKQQTSESLKPTTTVFPTAATLVSLWVFCRDLPSSARQLTWTFPVVLGSAAQELPERLVAMVLLFPIARACTTRSPDDDTRCPWPYQAGVALVSAAVGAGAAISSARLPTTGSIPLNDRLICVPPWTGCVLVRRVREGPVLPGLRRFSGNRDRRDHLLLIVGRVCAIVEGAHRRRVVDPAVDRVAKVVADEGGVCRTHAKAPRRVQLRVPGVLAQTDIVAHGGQRGAVELDAGVDAIVASAEGWQAASEIRVDLVECEAGAGGLGRARRRASKSPVVEIHADRAVGRCRQVGLELVRW